MQIFFRLASSIAVFMICLAASLSPAAAQSPARKAFDIGYEAYEKEDYKTAERYYGIACDGGFGTGCFNLALMHANGKLGAVNFPKAAQIYKTGCDKDDQESCNNLGVQYQNGRGVALDAGEAIRFYRKSCKLAADVGCANLAVMLEKDLDEQKPNDPRWREIASLNKRACEKHPHGCLRYGYSLYHGLGVPKDEAAAAAQFVVACDGDYSSGCYNLGLAYEEGKGVVANAAKSASYYARACALSNASGCHASGMMLMRGTGTPKDEVKAREHFVMACGGGVGGDNGGGAQVLSACGAAAYVYLAGLGGDVDVGEALRFGKEGCRIGDGDSCLIAALATPGSGAEQQAAAQALLDSSNGIFIKADPAARRKITSFINQRARNSAAKPDAIIRSMADLFY